MITIFPSKTLSVPIACSPAQVHAFVSDPRNLPQWARAFCKSISNLNGDWVGETPQGPVIIRFATDNKTGVLDHFVRPATGPEIYVPMRVISNGTGSALLFTIFRMPDMTEQQFMNDIGLVERDLANLKTVMEEQTRAES